MLTVNQWLSSQERLFVERPMVDVLDEDGAVTGEVKLADNRTITIEIFASGELIALSLSEFACLNVFYSKFMGEGSFLPHAEKEDLEEKTASQKLAEAPGTCEEKLRAVVSNVGSQCDTQKFEPDTQEPANNGTAGQAKTTHAGSSKGAAKAFEPKISYATEEFAPVTPEAAEALAILRKSDI